MLKIKLKSGIWSYKIGKTATVIRDEDRKAHIVQNYTLLGLTITQWDDGGYAISPRHIRSHIEGTILGEKNEPV